MNEHKAGIYLITGPTGRVYVGSSSDVRARLLWHIKALERNGHDNTWLQRSVNKYGIENFKFEQVVSITIVDRNTLFEYEDIMFAVCPKRYNLAPIAGSNFGYKWTAEQRAKLSAARKITMARPEVKAKSLAALARPEVRAKSAKAIKDKFDNDHEYRAKMLATLAAANSRPEVKESRKLSRMEVMARPEVRAKCAVALAAMMANPEVKSKRAATRARPEVKAKYAAAISFGTKTSWMDDNVRGARAKRNGAVVTVDGATTEHRSVYAAFVHHGLPSNPTGICQKFRLRLKASGREIFTHNGKEYVFELVK
jgi:group I intron endonuclease